MKIDLAPSFVLQEDAWIDYLNRDNDVLLFQSGWSNYRDNEKYIYDNPGIHPDVGFFLRMNFPNIKAIGFDWISISSYKNRALGREAHKAFLDPAGRNNPILIIEDMNLNCDLSNLKKMDIYPWQIEDIDSSPCTVVGGFFDKNNHI